MHTWTSHTVPANGINLHYVRTGGSGRVMIMLHGWSDDCMSWTPIAKQLENSYDLILPDARGHGRSDAPIAGYRMEVEQVDDLKAIIDAVEVERPIILGGSMGAVVALAFATRYPTSPAAVILVDPPLDWASANLDVIEDPGGFEWAREIIELKRMTNDEIAQYARSKWPRLSDDEVRYYAEAKLRLSFNVIIDLSKASTLDTRAIRKSMANVTCPILLIYADTNLGGMVSDENAEDLRQLIPHLQVVRIADAGHAIPRDQPSHFLSAVRNFLAGHGL